MKNTLTVGKGYLPEGSVTQEIPAFRPCVKHFGGTSGERVKQVWGLPGLVMFLHKRWHCCPGARPAMDGNRENFPVENSVGGGHSLSLRGQVEGVQEGGTRPGKGCERSQDCQAPSPLTSESLQQTGLSSPVPSRQKGLSVSGVCLPLRAASGSVRVLCPPPLPSYGPLASSAAAASPQVHSALVLLLCCRHLPFPHCPGLCPFRGLWGG